MSKEQELWDGIKHPDNGDLLHDGTMKRENGFWVPVVPIDWDDWEKRMERYEPDEEVSCYSVF